MDGLVREVTSILLSAGVWMAVLLVRDFEKLPPPLRPLIDLRANRGDISIIDYLR